MRPKLKWHRQMSRIKKARKKFLKTIRPLKWHGKTETVNGFTFIVKHEDE